MKFVAIYKQKGEGCDYTIGCGMRCDFFEAEDREKAKEHLYEKIVVGETYGTGDERETCWPYACGNKLSWIVLAEMPEDMLIKDWYKEIDIKVEEQQNRWKRAKEIKELERLKAKYGEK